MKRCSTSLIIKEMQIKTTVRSHLAPVRMVKNKNTGNRMWRKRNSLMHCWWECKLVQLLWKTTWRFLNKIELPYDLVILLLGIYPKNKKTLILKDIYTPMFTAALFTIAKLWKHSKCPSIDEWRKKWYTYTYYEYIQP